LRSTFLMVVMVMTIGVYLRLLPASGGDIACRNADVDLTNTHDCGWVGQSLVNQLCSERQRR
jgi:hypothetical protein